MDSSPSPQLKNAIEFLQSIPPEYWIAIAGGLILLFVLVRMMRKSSTKKLMKAAPQLVLSSFQIAPLGKDAFLKLVNNGEAATLSNIKILGRNDIEIKNNIAGQQIIKDGSYRILLETNINERLTANFKIEVTFVDLKRNAYKQVFAMDTRASVSLKRTNS